MGNSVYTCLPSEQTADPIAALALDLRWTWNHSTDQLWHALDPELWEATQNPWLILQAVSKARLERVLADPRFRDKLESLLETQRKFQSSAAWFQNSHPDSPLQALAYFSMEYMLGEALPIYSGGLGNVAGDQLKAASDLGVPVIGVGLLYQQGYFRQEIDASGRQVARFPFNDPGRLPIRPLRTRDGDWLRLKLSLPACTLWLRSWEVKVGRRTLYLLDTNDPANSPAHRLITSELYGGGSEDRLRQEAVLGIGGWRLLRALGLRPEVCHLNEGHASFAVLERARAFMEDNGRPFDVALAVTRVGNLFTTHTPVEAGFDRFSPELMESHFKTYAEEQLKIGMPALMALGRRNPDDKLEPFNMAYLGIRGAGAVNGVSRLHGAVSRRLFQVLFPRWTEAEIPIGYVTNGVHVPTWDSADADSLWERACGQERWRRSLEYVDEQIRCVEDREIWQLRTELRKTLVTFVRSRLRAQCAYNGAPREEIEEAGSVFDENRLTLGFARRFTAYKRPNMLLHDPNRLAAILTNPARPTQLVLAGKAHPQDMVGQELIHQWHEFIRRPDVRGHIVFLADYDMLLTQQLVAGVDLWINTPRRPWEACGTSGMKILANGGLNLSERDGWWAEAYAPDVGWAIGDGKDRGEDPAWDAIEAEALYSLLEREVIPTFYDRDERGIARQWAIKARESMARLTPAFSSNRTIRQYTEEFYLPLASAYRARAQEASRTGAELCAWMRTLTAQWSRVRFGRLEVTTHHSDYLFEVEVQLGKIDPGDVQVEIYADPHNSDAPFRVPMILDHSVPGSPGAFKYSGAAPADRPADYYTPRVIPRRNDVRIPLELPLIVWQK